jgi:hypothetical protein
MGMTAYPDRPAVAIRPFLRRAKGFPLCVERPGRWFASNCFTLRSLRDSSQSEIALVIREQFYHPDSLRDSSQGDIALMRVGAAT